MLFEEAAADSPDVMHACRKDTGDLERGLRRFFSRLCVTPVEVFDFEP